MIKSPKILHPGRRAGRTGQPLVRREPGRTRGEGRSAGTELIPATPGNTAVSRTAKAALTNSKCGRKMDEHLQRGEKI